MSARRTASNTAKGGVPKSKLLTAVAGSILLSLAMAGCSGGPTGSIKMAGKPEVDPKLGVAPSPRVVALGKTPPKGGGRSMVGKPYTVAGKRYVPRLDPDYEKVGLASWYGDAFHGRYTANGEIYDANALTAAHPTMPLPSYARVTSLTTGRSITVRVNDRGPFHGNRVLDVSRRTAEMLGIRNAGIAKVKVEYVGAAPRHGDDSAMLMASFNGPASVPVGMPETMVASADSLPGVAATPAVASKPAVVAPTVVAAAEPATAEAGQFPTVVAAIPPVRPALTAEEAYVIVASLDPADAFFEAGGASVQVASAETAVQPTLAGYSVGSFKVGPQPIGFSPSADPAALQVPLPEAPPARSSYAADRVEQAYAAVDGFASGVGLGDLARRLDRASNRTLTATVVQVGVFANPENADRIADALDGIGRVAIDDIVIGGRSMKSVRIAALAEGVAVDDAVAAAVRAGADGARAVSR